MSARPMPCLPPSALSFASSLAGDILLPLTAMASPLAKVISTASALSGARLPDDRADLFNEIVELLLKRWTEHAGDEKSLREALDPKIASPDFVARNLTVILHNEERGKAQVSKPLGQGDAAHDVAEADVVRAVSTDQNHAHDRSSPSGTGNDLLDSLDDIFHILVGHGREER